MTTRELETNVADSGRAGLDEFVPTDPYRAWQEREGVRVVEGCAFDDLRGIELSPWPRKGGSGAILNIAYPTLMTDAHLVEIQPGQDSEPEHHLYEEQVYIVSGRGRTAVWPEGGARQSFEWEAGALFAIPLNAWYQHSNIGREPLRYLAVTNAPPMMRLLADGDAVFGAPLSFRSRFAGEQGYFSPEGRLYGHRVWRSNLVPDAPHAGLYDWKERGGGGMNVLLEMAGNTALKAHLSEFPVGTYKKAHRHGPGYHLTILSGQGFSLLWTEEDMSDLQKRDWTVNGMVIIPSHACFHQHFNTGNDPARYLAIRPGNMGVTAPAGYSRPEAQVPIKEGGWQVEYEDESRRVHELFEAELAKHGATCAMKALVPWCTAERGAADRLHT